MFTDVLECNDGGMVFLQKWIPSGNLSLENNSFTQINGVSLQVHQNQNILPSGYLTQPWKIPDTWRFLTGKIIYKWAIFHGYVSHNQMVNYQRNSGGIPQETRRFAWQLHQFLSSCSPLGAVGHPKLWNIPSCITLYTLRHAHPSGTCDIIL